MAFKRISALFAGAAVALGGAAVASPVAVAAPPAPNEDGTCTPKTISLVGVTDFHGHIENATKVAQGLADKRAENPNTLFVSVGDNVGASAFESSIDSDNPSMDILKAMGLVVSATGNHEFDQGGADIVNRVMPRIGAPYISSNIGGTAPDPVGGGTVTLTDSIKPYYIHEVDGVKVGFVGAVTETLLAAVSPALNGGVEVSSIAENVNKYASELKDGNEANGEADIVVVLVHEDGEHTAAGFTSPAIDAVLSGHTHLAEKGTTASGAPFIEAKNYGYAYSDLDMTLACDGTVTVNAEIVETDSIEPDASDPLVATVQGLYDNAAAYAKEQGGRVLGCISSGTFNRGVTDPGTKSSEGGTENRGVQSTLGQLEADIALWTANQNLADGADIGFINSGGLRSDLDAGGTVSTANDGIITLEEAHNVTPFGNTNAVVTLTGAQLKKVLEQQWQPIGARRPVLWLGTSSNVTYNYLPYAVDAEGNRVDSYTTNEEGKLVDDSGAQVYPRGTVIDLKVNGKDVADTDTFRVAGNSFLLAGGDDFTAFTEGTGYVDTGYVDFQGVMDYMAANTKMDGDTCVTGLAAPATRNTAGVTDFKVDPEAKTVEAALSGLAFSTDEPVPAGAYVAINGVPLGYFDGIERKATPGLTPETGSLSVKAEGLCDAAIAEITKNAGEAGPSVETVEVVLGERTAELDARFDVNAGVCAAPVVEPTPAPSEPAGQPATQQTPVPVAEEKPFEYENCTAVWNDIHRPIKAGERGFTSKLDADNDGIGCEIDPTANPAGAKAAEVLAKTGSPVGMTILGSFLFTAAGLVLVRRKVA